MKKLYSASNNSREGIENLAIEPRRMYPYCNLCTYTVTSQLLTGNMAKRTWALTA